MSTLAERIEEIRQADPQYTVGFLARAARVSSSAVSQWRSGKSQITLDSAYGIQAETGFNAHWIVRGALPKRVDKVENSPQPSHDHLSGILTARELMPRSYAVPPIIDWETVVQEGSSISDIFAVAVPDDALMPKTPKGTLLAFSRHAAAAPGKGVIVQDRRGAVHLRRFAQGPDGTWVAQASNDAYLSFHSERDGLQLLAVATWREGGEV